MACTRRTWLQNAAALSLAAPLTSLAAAYAAEADAPARPAAEIAVFTKSFQDWDLPELCRRFAALNISGLDLTVRPGGHIAPENVARDLPVAHKIAAEHGLKIVQITSSVTETDDATRNLFATAGELGIRPIKLGYYRSTTDQPLTAQISAVQRTLESLAQLAASSGVLPCVHIHSGTYLPSHGTLLYLMLKEFDPAQIGAYVDTLHMSFEGAGGGWKQGLQLLAPWMRLCAVKNYRIIPKGRDKAGQQTWGWNTCPLADGHSPLPDFVKTLQQLHYRGPFSLHSEYKPELDTAACFAQTQADLAYFRGLLKEK